MAEIDGRRYLNATDVANYISISRTMVDILVGRGVLPEPIELTPRLKRWDRLAIDKALSGSKSTIPDPQLSATDIFRGIADGILAKGRLPSTKATRRRHS